ncbi:MULTISPECIES: DUF4352 domain-containing protein [unclassified Listeria]|uniref:DUF4352 domain-containing protein n=1 Tax=unclassified Listeria TaxID=2642072 RepID=UPI000B594DC9|nr:MULTISPECIES: DUF4352 domain-containing protein [unclassified Listeria]
MKKVLLAVLSGTCALSLVACSAPAKDEGKENNKQESVEKKASATYPVKTVDNVEMKIESIETTENGKGDKNIVQINMNFENENATPWGVGGSEFIIKDGDKTYTVIPDANNIGTDIEANKSVSGAINFELPKSVKSGDLSYKPVTFGKEKPKVLATWEISIPDNK